MMFRSALLVCMTVVVLQGGFIPYAPAHEDDDVGQIVYVPTPEVVVEKMLKMAKVGKTDVVFDLGCGDGRIVAIATKKFGAKKAVGVDIDPDRIKDSMETLKKYKVPKGVVEIRQGNALKVKDMNKATVVTLYMLPEFMRRLEPQAKKLKPGTRIVSHDFQFPNWKPDQTVEFRGPERDHTLFLWVVKEPSKGDKK